MKFICEIDMDNAAFEDPYELASLLLAVSERVRESVLLSSSPEPRELHVHAPIHDTNGNHVGRWEIA